MSAEPAPSGEIQTSRIDPLHGLTEQAVRDLAKTAALAEHVPVAIYHAEEGGRVTYGNSAYRRLMNLGPDDALTDRAKSVHADDRARMTRAWEDCGRHLLPANFVYRSCAPQGACRVLEEQVVAAAGVAGFIGTITDITERVAAQESVQRVETLLRDTFDQAPIGIAYADRRGNFIGCNRAYCELLGLTTSEIKTKSIAEVTYEDDLGRNDVDIGRLWRGEIDSYSTEKRYRRKDRNIVWVRITATLVRDAEGAPECSIGFVQDISDRKEIEVALQQNQKLLETIINDVPVAILASDMSGRVLIHNREADDLFILHGTDGQGDATAASYSPALEVFLPDGVTPVPREARPLARALRGESITNMELVITQSGGGRHTILQSARRLLGKDGEYLGAVVVAQNITERKQSEIEFERVHRQLLDASRLAGMAEVATSVLHNVGNVLNSVNISASLVAERIGLSRFLGLARAAALLKQRETDLATFLSTDERGRQLPQYLAQLAEQLQSDQRVALEEMTSLSNNIDHIKETVAMQQNYARQCGITETVAVAALVEDSLRMNVGALTRHGVTLRREIADLPPISVDKHKVLQILVNLVRNAKYACDESDHPDKILTVRVEERDAVVRISVIDNGVGISSENMRRLFTHGFTTRKTGHGFGLHSSALAAREIDGSLTAHSDGPGRGAMFTLELPRRTQTA
jgi:PAS domain S-box-containing protein